MSIEVKNISKKFANFTALSNINLKVETGELVALLGPSGCGKTTLLRIIAGLENADEGKIILNDEDSSTFSPSKRRVGFVFQHYALFRHMNVFKNVAFGLEIQKGDKKLSKVDIEKNVMELLTMVQMDWAKDRLPNELSGGQRQRVALARALAVKPNVLLLDEPFSALDAKVRLELRRWLRKLHEELHITSVFVTHDQEEALELADRIVIINKGEIEQEGSPDEVYEKPANAFVYGFLGNINIFHGRGGEDDPDSKSFLRPHEVRVFASRQLQSDIEAQIEEARTTGANIRLELSCEGAKDLITAVLSRDYWKSLSLKKGDRVFINLERMVSFVEDYSI